jgi:PelA/Pel-15E family pectate lyase
MGALLLVALTVFPTVIGSGDLADQAATAMAAATRFFRTEVSSRGGYLWEYSEDMAEWWGEVEANPAQVWVQPPGTPEVGLVFLRAYEVTGDRRYLEAAVAAADALIWGQLVHGGWEYRIDFLGEGSWRYRHEAVDDPYEEGRCTFDDEVTQAATRLLMGVDAVVGREPYTEAARYALEFMMEAQFPNGAWPQWYPLTDDYPDSYTDYYTYNDQVINDCIELMVEAYQVYGDERYLESAERGGNFIILSQVQEPQPGWAQQYYWNLSPAWARSYEPPAVCSKVTSNNMITLLELYLLTGNATYLEPLPAAIDWLNRSKIGEDLWARFYELGTNTPLYCDRDRKLTYNLSEVSEERRTGYGWQGGYGLGGMRMYGDVIAQGREQYLAERNREMTAEEKLQRVASLEGRVRDALAALDEDGRWVEDGWIYAKTFNRNLGYILSYLEYSGWEGGLRPLPAFGSFSVNATGGRMLLSVNVTHPGGLESVSGVVLRFTPPTWRQELDLVDDGSGGDAAGGDGIYTLALEPDPGLSLAVYQGMVIAHDMDGNWNLTLLPLGKVAEAAAYLEEIELGLAEAREIGVDVPGLEPGLQELRAGLGAVDDDSDTDGMLQRAGDLRLELETIVVGGLIDAAEEVIRSGGEAGIDTSRHEIFLARAREEYGKGNMGPARSFTVYPLSLREEIPEGAPVLATVLVGLALLARRMQRWPT